MQQQQRQAGIPQTMMQGAQRIRQGAQRIRRAIRTTTTTAIRATAAVKTTPRTRTSKTTIAGMKQKNTAQQKRRTRPLAASSAAVV